MRFITKTVTALSLVLAFSNANALETFTIEDIQVDGLQRVELGSFFTALPIRVGETLDKSRAPNLIRSLYSTGNFDFVKLEKIGNTLKVTVAERPIISDIILSGNKVLKSEQLLESMKGAGIEKGGVLNSFVLDKIEQGITSEYFNNGHYHLDIDKKIVSLSRNRVQLQITIKEGESAKIKDINIVGNNLFDDETLIKQMELTTGGIFSFITSDDKYSSQKLEKDIETITSYYQDRGYLTTKVSATQVSLSENKEDVYITLNIDEGNLFTVNDVKFVGDLKYEYSFFKGISPIKKGDTYSKALTTFMEEQIKSLLGLKGFTFAKVKVIPEIVSGSDEVDLVFTVDPGSRYYAKNISFKGNLATDENVFRREARLQEGTPLSSSLVERSKLRMQRLPFVEEVSVDIQKTEQLGEADVVFDIKERNSSEATLSLGYNDFYGFQIQGGLTNRNFLGEGKTAGINVSTNKAIQSLNVNYTDPYYFSDNIGFGANFTYRKTDFSKFYQVGRSLDTIGIAANLFYSISESSNINLGINLQNNTLKAPVDPRTRAQDQRVLDFFESLGSNARTESEIDFTVAALNLGYQNNTLNRYIFPSRGYQHSVNLEYATPAGDAEYYKATYNYKHYFPIVGDKWIFAVRATLGYGEGLGDTGRLPYFVNFYAGGASSIRGYEGNTIGPKSILRQFQYVTATNPALGGSGAPVLLPEDNDLLSINRRFSVGGNAKAIASFEFIFPTPFISENKSVRTSAFVDVGNVWDTKFDPKRFNGLGFVPGSGITNVPDFSDASSYRGSYGISLQWVSPFAPIQFSLSKTFNAQQFDDTKTFTFTLGQTF